MKNKNGFTLVELLAVIVILAVVMLMAVTAVGPLMARARKASLANEGLALVDAAKTAYQADQMEGTVKATESKCYSLSDLVTNGYYDKSDSGYSGSVQITYVTGGKYTYTVWISNGAYAIQNVDSGAVKGSSAAEGGTASTTCGI